MLYTLLWLWEVSNAWYEYILVPFHIDIGHGNVIHIYIIYLLFTLSYFNILLRSSFNQEFAPAAWCRRWPPWRWWRSPRWRSGPPPPPPPSPAPSVWTPSWGSSPRRRRARPRPPGSPAGESRIIGGDWIADTHVLPLVQVPLASVDNEPEHNAVSGLKSARDWRNNEANCRLESGHR